VSGVRAEVPQPVTIQPLDARRVALPRARRVGMVVMLVLGALLASAGSAMAAPIGTADQVTGKGHGGGGGGGGGNGGGGGSKGTVGYDIGWPQCNGAYPSNPAFGIVGVNLGLVFSTNPCLASQIAWAGGPAGELYVNTGNPGPGLSSFWPVGQTVPRFCDPVAPDSADCAYDYGWNAAAHSWEVAVAAYDQLGITVSPASTSWWLDVETSNSWRSEAFALPFNVAALQGQVDYLLSVGVTKLGFYSTTVQWGEITGATTVFAAYPSWGAGAPSLRVAKSHCESTPGFTGGNLALVQYPWAGFDADLRC
jgi:hypothetical protein